MNPANWLFAVRRRKCLGFNGLPARVNPQVVAIHSQVWIDTRPAHPGIKVLPTHFEFQPMKQPS
jgi:hypothetical protein